MPKPGTPDYARLVNFTNALYRNLSVRTSTANLGRNPHYRPPGTPDEELPEWDGLVRARDENGTVHVLDTEGLDHVDEKGFDAHGNFYPFKARPRTHARAHTQTHARTRTRARAHAHARIHVCRPPLPISFRGRACVDPNNRPVTSTHALTISPCG
jgi:hypothetical protein